MSTVLQTIMLILAILLVLQIFILFVNQMPDMGKGQYHLMSVLEFVMLRVPYELSICFPVICLLGCLIGLSVLASHSELVILRTTGLSIADILKIVATAGIGFILLAMLLSELFIPEMMYKANSLKLEAMNEGQVLRQAQSLWFRNLDNFWFVEAIDSPNHLKSVTLFKKDEEGILKSIEYFFQVNWVNGQWQAKSIEKTFFSKNKMRRLRLDNVQGLNLPLTPTFFKHIEHTPDEMSLKGLWQRIHQLRNQQDISKDELIFWQRVLQPFNTLLMMLLAIPCVFGPLRESTMGAKLIVGIVIGFGFYILNQMFGFVSQVYQLPPILGASLPLFIFGILGVFLLKRTT